MIIYSVVGTDPGSLSFAGDQNRFNVAATRPKSKLVVVGNISRIGSKTKRNNILRSFIKYASDKNAVFDWNEKTRMTPTLPSPLPDDVDTNTSENTSNELPAKALKRLSDIVTMQPTSNGELASRWDMDSGKEVYRYISSTLDEYVYRDASNRLRATDEAFQLTNSSS